MGKKVVRRRGVNRFQLRPRVIFVRNLARRALSWASIVSQFTLAFTFSSRVGAWRTLLDFSGTVLLPHDA